MTDQNGRKIGHFLPFPAPFLKKCQAMYNTAWQICVGVTGFEPATSRPPAERSSQTEPYPERLPYYGTSRRKMQSLFLFFEISFFSCRTFQGRQHILQKKTTLAAFLLEMSRKTLPKLKSSAYKAGQDPDSRSCSG